jgi:hypothetical protein
LKKIAELKCIIKIEQTKFEFMKKSQIKGIAIVIFSVLAYLLLDNNLMQTISGVLCAIGLGYILKWIPFKKQNLTE